MTRIAALLLLIPLTACTTAEADPTPTPSSESVSLGPAPTSPPTSEAPTIGDAVQARTVVRRTCAWVIRSTYERTGDGPWQLTHRTRRPTGNTCPPVPTHVTGGR